jgi:acyl-CoA thioester hydrolase
VVAESGCRYFAELAFPAPLAVGLAVTRLGTSSVTYRLAVFEPSGGERSDGEMVSTDAPVPVAAVGNWVHVYVDRGTRRPVPIPEAIRGLLATAEV